MLKTFTKKDVFRKRVFLRADLNISLPEDKSKILEKRYFRVEKLIPTLEKLLKYKAKIILATHLGRPAKPFQKEFSTAPLQEILLNYLDVSISKAPDVIGKTIQNYTLYEMLESEILLLENLRFYKQEQENDLQFAKELAKLADVYVSDAFSVCHRKHASVYQLPKLLPSFAGFLLKSEVDNLSKVKNNPKKPCIVILGGKKVDDKVKSIKGFLKFADFILVNNLAHQEIKKNYKHLLKDKRIIFPVDSRNNLDIGNKTISLFSKYIQGAKTIVWSGPLGKFEDKRFSLGSQSIAKAIIKSKAFSVIGGGQTIEFAMKFNLLDKFSFASTGGGAMLHFLAGNPMPGLQALERKK